MHLRNSDLVSTSVLQLWHRLIQYTEQSLASPEEHANLCINPLINDVYPRESAFAAKILATEWTRTGENKYFDLALSLLERLDDLYLSKIEEGLPEPYILPRGYVFKHGSVPGTLIYLHAVKEASKILKIQPRVTSSRINNFILKCYCKGGGFAHDSHKTNKNKSTYSPIINTTSMAVYFLASSANSQTNHILPESISFIVKSQRRDGFWPYVGTSAFSRLFWNCRHWLPSSVISSYNRILGDKSIFFGDFLHHVVTLYFTLLAVKNNRPLLQIVESSLHNGMNFVAGHCSETKDYLSLDFSWEPPVKKIRHCNFMDTSTYFYLAASILLYEEIFPEFNHGISLDKLLNYTKTLQSHPTLIIEPYDAKVEKIQLMMQRPAESPFDKAFLLSFLIDKYCESSIHEY